ncbi:MAG: hypothetical protein IJW38_05525 [Clostridia bacterium]|nr:hypothetical protein [Clostridia bacterium]
MIKAFKRKGAKLLAIFLAVAILIVLLLEIGIRVRSHYDAYIPDYDKIDIRGILNKDELADEDYETLFLQTGLTRLGIDGLLEKGLINRIIKIQEQYFKKQDYYLYSFAPFTGYLRRSSAPKVAYFAYLENGDILYSPTTFFSFVRLAHASMVVDSSLGLMAQASGYGSPVKYVHVNHFFARPAFVVLRVNENVGASVASYTTSNLIGVRYSLLAGIFGDKAPDNLTSTHCSHFIWYAYQRYGIDLDSNGGKIVTPDDILHSENVSIVQIYGIAPEKIIE